MFDIINTALEAITIILNLLEIFPVESRYIEILLAFIWFAKFISKYVWQIQIKFSFLNQHIYYPKIGLD
jgi:hypothetical protein